MIINFKYSTRCTLLLIYNTSNEIAAVCLLIGRECQTVESKYCQDIVLRKEF